jgi:HEPN domain-containing protein
MSKINIAEGTFRIAESDLAAADLIFRSGFDFQNRLAFTHYQQAAEKYLKALLFLRDIEVPKTHDLDTLQVMCIQLEPTLPKVELLIFRDFGNQVRYSDLIFDGPTPQDLQYARERCLEVREALLPHFPKEWLTQS